LYNIKFTEEGTVEIIDTDRTSSHKRCKDGCGDLFDLKVEKIEKINENIEHVYDFSVNNDENFIGGLQPICLHNSTIEGGMVCTNDDELYNILKMIRSHGWDRDLDEDSQKKLRDKWGTDDFSALYTFYVPGFNLRSTDLQAYIGIGQLEKIEDIIKKRHENFCYFEKLLKGNTSWWPKIPFSDFISSFCIPIIFDNIAQKEMAVQEFNDNNIEVRPLIAGSMGTQPFYIERYGVDNKEFCSIIDERGIYVPNHPGLEFEDIKRICDIILKYN
jgi:CDP-6-deoxy-D-xylo-4-hexulose-3-dehydrase